MREKPNFLSITKVCKDFGYSRDAYYKRKKRVKRHNSQKDEVIEMVRSRRHSQPREGTKKLYYVIKAQLKAKGIKVGRDKLFDILRDHDMLIKPRKSYVKTTNSNHQYKKYANLVKDFRPTGKNQLWVSDITYIRTVNGFCYLALITDAYSRKIVGYDISDSLELEGALRALKKALRSLPAGQRPIHHSDRGIQYCSHEYTRLLRKNELPISMASKGNCYENALAERVNGILKQEFFLDQKFINKSHAIKTSKESIKIYNNKRLHIRLGYKTPESVHLNAA